MQEMLWQMPRVALMPVQLPSVPVLFAQILLLPVPSMSRL
jgi:hypothetical protein